MKYLLLGGNSQPEQYKIISKTLKEMNVERLLFIGIVRNDDGKEKFMQVLNYDPAISNYSPILFDRNEYIEGKLNLSNFDSIMIPGGDFEPILNFVDKTNFRTDFVNWFQSNNSKVYIGSSIGVKILGKYMFNYSDGKLDEAKLVDTGFSIIPDVLFDVHFSQFKLQNRMKQALLDHPELRMGVGIDENSYLIADDDEKFNINQLMGGVHIFRNY